MSAEPPANNEIDSPELKRQYEAMFPLCSTVPITHSPPKRAPASGEASKAGGKFGGPPTGKARRGVG